MFKYGHTIIDHVGLDIDLTDLSDVFGKILSKFGISVDHYHAFSDPITGDIFINLSDHEGDSIDAILTIDSDNIPGCSILDKSDRELGWIDLEGIAPVVNGRIDFGEGKWFRFSILTNLLKLGEVDFNQIRESKSKSVVRTITRIEEAFTVKGARKIAVVSHRNRYRILTTRQQLGLMSARRKSKAENSSSVDDESNRITDLEKQFSKYLRRN
jgi:hypothetical protein